MLTVSELSKSYGDRTLFSGVTFRLSEGRRLALVGGNGVGKTTILEMVVGLAQPDSGTVSKPSEFVIGYLPQELLETSTKTVIDEAKSGALEIMALAEKLQAAEDRMQTDTSEEAIEAYGELQSSFQTLGGYQLEADAKKVLGSLGFSAADMERPVAELSGGWRMRTALARLLIQKPDVLVLDEPTNHLDLPSVAWLEEHLAAWPGAILFVSHDRDFLDAVCERVLEIAGGEANEYVGSFTEFVIAREERIAVIEAARANQARKVAQTERFIERFRYKATKARQVQSRIKALNKLDIVEAPKLDDLKLKFAYPDPPKSARVVVNCEDASLGYEGLVVLNDVNIVVERGEKVALVGANGAGKSTVIKTLIGEIPAIAGTVEVGNNVDIAYFAQHHVEALDLSATVYDEFRATVGEKAGDRNLRTILGSFGFSGDDVETRVGDLSGGERTRLALAEVLCNPVNLLILDEPTNHLDLASCDLLEDALRSYPGTVLLVSHDRYLIRNVAEKLVDVSSGTVRTYDHVSEEVLHRKPIADSGQKVPNSRKLSRQLGAEERKTKSTATKDLRKHLRKLETAAVKAEEQLKALELELADPATYADKARMDELLKKHDPAAKKAEQAMKAWEEAALELEKFD